MPDIIISSLHLPPGYHVQDASYTFLILLSGQCRIEGNTVSFDVCEKNAALLQSGEHYTLSGDCSLIRIAFTRELFFRSLLPLADGAPMLTSFFVHKGETPTVSYLHFRSLSESITLQASRMLEEYSRQEDNYESILVYELMSLLLQITRTSWVDASITAAPNSQILQQMLDYLVTHYRTVTLDELAERFSYHPNSAAAILKRGTGKNFSALLLQTRMSHASKLLLQNELSISQVAEMCGYTNMSNFYARFEAYFGMTPGKYAKIIRSREKAEAQRE